MGTMMQKVIGHCSGAKTSGANTLAIAVECIDHMAGPSGDWTPLAALIGRHEKAQGAVVKLITREVVLGWSVSTKDTNKQTGGVRFDKQKKANQGFDEDKISLLRKLVARKVSIQSPEVKAIFKKEEEEEADWDYAAAAKRMKKSRTAEELANFIAELQK